MKKHWRLEYLYLLPAFAIGLAGLGVAALSPVPPQAPAAPESSSVNVTQHHNDAARTGLFIDSAFTLSAAANLTRDTSFNGTIVGNVYAQPLYIEDGPGGAAMVIAVTESNNVYALNAATGAIIWQRNVGMAISSGLPCGNITPVGITGTPIVDLASRSLFFDAEISGTGHQIFSLNVDTGATNIGWPVTLNTAVSGFDSSTQSERGALGIVGNIVYVPYGGRFGDCTPYRGRLVGVQINNPGNVLNWATGSAKAGVWAPGGVASDGTNTYVTTGNGSGSTWAGNEAVIRLQPGPVFSGSTIDYWAPTNWFSLDGSDLDLGGSGPVLVDVPGATPSALVVALGKDSKAYLLNRNNLGGIVAPVASATFSGFNIQAAATYRTALATHVVFRPTTGTLSAFRITATNPPTIATGWSISSSGRSSPFVTSTDGTNNMIVWTAGSDHRLRGYNGDTGAVIYNGGGATDAMAGTRSFNTGIVARGRIYYAGDSKVYAFNVGSSSTPTPSPTATPTPTPTPTASPTPTPTPTATPIPVTVSLPIDALDPSVPITTNILKPVLTTNIDPKLNLVAFQGDFTFDETVVNFQTPFVFAAGLTANKDFPWSVQANILEGTGPTARILRIFAAASDGNTPLEGSGVLFNLRMRRVSSTPGASSPLAWRPVPNNFLFIDTDLATHAPSQPNGLITILGLVDLSGTVSYCSNPTLGPVPGVTLNLTGNATTSTLSDGSGNYTFAGLAAGGSYTVTPVKTALTAGSDGIDGVDVLAVQRHFLSITLIPAGCARDAADVDGDADITGVDAFALQRFYLGFATGTANVGQYRFTPANRSYSPLTGSQTGQNYDTLILGDVALGFIHRPEGGQAQNFLQKETKLTPTPKQFASGVAFASGAKSF